MHIIIENSWVWPGLSHTPLALRQGASVEAHLNVSYVLLFSKASSTKPLIKALSTEYRRRLLIGEIRNSANNKDVISKYNVVAFPTLLVVKEDSSEVKFEKQPTFNR